jgi:hypothetical protein
MLWKPEALTVLRLNHCFWFSWIFYPFLIFIDFDCEDYLKSYVKVHKKTGDAETPPVTNSDTNGGLRAHPTFVHSVRRVGFVHPFGDFPLR